MINSSPYRSLTIDGIAKRTAGDLVVAHHYLHRKPPMSYAFGIWDDLDVLGVCTFGTPPSRHAQMSVCPSDPSMALELNRLWIDDDLPGNTASWFVAGCLRLLPPRIVFSYADTAVGHHGGVYRAMSWNYAGQTDEDRKTPRFDYVPDNGNHSRDAFRTGEFTRVRRKPKHRYWTTTGSARQRRRMVGLCGWDARPYPEVAA